MLSEARIEATVPVSDLNRGRAFYGDTLGLRPAGAHHDGADLLFESGGGTRLLLYERGTPGAFPPPPHTVAHFEVPDVEAAVRELRGAGVVFDELDAGELKTVDGVATLGEKKFAWFKDPDANVLGIHD
jgi:catechol 2,3-dioxygenase-like lactoylglutathione lyase family enzyme